MAKSTDFSERISQVIDYIGITRNDFAKKLGYNRSQALYDMINGKALPSFDFFHKLLDSEFSAIDIEWLITGKGNMIKKGFNISLVENIEPLSYKAQCQLCTEKERLIEAIQDSIKAKDLTISSLIDQIELLKRQLFEAHQDKDGQKRKAS